MAKENGNELIVATGFYAGHSAKGNFDIELRLQFPEVSVADALQFVAGIGNRLKMVALVGDQKIKLGTWQVYKLTVDKNAQTTVVFKTNKEYSEIENLPLLMVDEEEIIVKAKIVPQE